MKKRMVFKEWLSLTLLTIAFINFAIIIDFINNFDLLKIAIIIIINLMIFNLLLKYGGKDLF